MVLTQGENGTLALRESEDETYHITVAEWAAECGDLQRSHVEYYLSYTMQIFQMAESYDWSSILAFDTCYRQLQAAYGFLWGDTKVSPQMQLLKPKRPATICAPSL